MWNAFYACWDLRTVNLLCLCDSRARASAISTLAKTRVNSTLSKALEGMEISNSRGVATKKRVQCRMWTVHGNCTQGAACQFAHGAQEIQRETVGAVLGGEPKVDEPMVVAVPGTVEADLAFESPTRDYFDQPAPYEVAYGVEEEKALAETKSRQGEVNASASAWRRIEHNGVTYWYNELTGVSQWEDPTQATEESRGREVQNGDAPRNDDFEALVKAADGDSICEPIGDGVLLRVIVKPSQPEDNVLDVTPSCVKVSLRAPIEDRWCNQALLAFCRRALHVPQRERNAVKITDGDESLDKIVHIPALTPKEVIKRLHKRRDFEVDTNDVEKWIRHTERKQKEEERRMKRRKWA